VKFRSERYPKLKVRVPGAGKSRYVQFEGGELDVTDKDAIEVLKGLPADRGVKAVGGRPAKESE